MRAIDADKLNAFIGDERATLHNEQRTFKAMSENEFNTRDYMLSNFQYIIDNAPTVDFTFEETFQKTICENRMYCPARPTGEWENPFEMNGKSYHKCNSCHVSSQLILIVRLVINLDDEKILEIIKASLKGAEE